MKLRKIKMEDSGFFVHEKGICESTQIGSGTRIWAFAHILPGARIGSDCNICDGVFIENDVQIGDRVTVKGGVQLWDGLVAEDDVFIGPNATFTNDLFPRSKVYPEQFQKTVLRKGASIGANATILPGVEIGEHAMVGAGAVVTRSVPRYAIAMGNPASITGYVNATAITPPAPKTISSRLGAQVELIGVGTTALHHLPLVKDMRGDLSVGEFEQHIPFKPKRYFIVFDVPSRETRGEHAHRQCHQFLLCVKGTCSVVADDGQSRREIELDRPNLGLYLPPMIWGIQYKYSTDAVLLVFASEYYDPSDYIREYDKYLDIIQAIKNT